VSHAAPGTADAIGVRELRNRLSAVLRRIENGRAVAVTRRNRIVALFVPGAGRTAADLLGELARAGCLAWSGGKPAGSRRPPRVRGASVADAVLEARQGGAS
jgi:antitoxin (DNA-binding transcriptional repressor) of toxin-antitoxin stability system